jgi:hypothetical protein
MANHFGYQFNAGCKPKMVNIEGFVSIGTGGMVNAATASGTTYGILPGAPTGGVPTGWQGGFSGVIGLYGAGVQSIARTATGTYAVVLDSNYTRCDSVQVTYYAGASGSAQGLDYYITSNTVGAGNTVAATQNTIVIQFESGTTGVDVDVPASAGFYIALRLRDNYVGNTPQ